MIRQTIALFQYLLLGVINRKLVALIVALYLLVFLAGQFGAELAIINSDLLAPALQAELMRYSLVLILIIVISVGVVKDYDSGQFERLLSMPVRRAQYVVAQYLLILVCVALFAVPALMLLWVSSDPDLAWYWFFALMLELLLVGQFALLAAVSLENLSAAVLLALALYLLSRLAPVLDAVFSHSVDFYNEEQGFQLMHWLFGLIQYVLPDARVFAVNDLFFEPQSDLAAHLGEQALSLLIYSAFVFAVLLVDFYRKEFSRS